MQQNFFSRLSFTPSLQQMKSKVTQIASFGIPSSAGLTKLSYYWVLELVARDCPLGSKSILAGFHKLRTPDYMQ